MPIYEAAETDFELVPEGTIVHAVVKAIELKSWDWGDRLNWKFEITDGEYKGMLINDGTSPKLSIDPPSKLYKWATALLGRTLDVGERLDTDDLIGLRCRIVVGHKPDKNNPDTIWLRADEVFPASGAGSAEDVFG